MTAAELKEALEASADQGDALDEVLHTDLDERALVILGVVENSPGIQAVISGALRLAEVDIKPEEIASITARTIRFVKNIEKASNEGWIAKLSGWARWFASRPLVLRFAARFF